MSKRRLVWLGAAVALVASLATLGAPAANGEQFTRPDSPGCVTSFTLYSGAVPPNLAFVNISFHLTMEAHSPVTVAQGAWTLNSSVGMVHWWQGSSSRTVDWWVGTAGEQYTRVNIVRGSTGSIVYKLVKPGTYGGCFFVDHIVVTRAYYTTPDPSASAPPGGGGFSPPPPPSATPSPFASPSGGCNPNLAGCDPPAGYCWGYGPPAPGEEWPIYPCESAPPPSGSPSPTPSPTAPNFCPTTTNGVCIIPGTYSAQHQANNPPTCPGSGGSTPPVSLGPTGVMAASGTVYQYKVTLGAHSVTRCTTGLPSSGGGSLKLIIQTGVNAGSACLTASNTGGTGTMLSGANPTGDYVGTFTVNSTCAGQTVRWEAGYTFDNRDDYSFTLPYGEAWPIGSAPGSPSPTPSATPTPATGPTNSPPPGYPTPPQSDPEQSPDLNIHVDLCADNPDILACEENALPSFGNPDASQALDNFSQLFLDAKGRAPFGYVDQVSTAIAEGTSGASAGGSAADYCFTLPYWTSEGMQSAEGCLPLQDMADAAAWVRPILLVMLTLVVSVGLVRWVTRTAPG